MKTENIKEEKIEAKEVDLFDSPDEKSDPNSSPTYADSLLNLL